MKRATLLLASLRAEGSTLAAFPYRDRDSVQSGWESPKRGFRRAVRNGRCCLRSGSPSQNNYSIPGPPSSGKPLTCISLGTYGGSIFICKGKYLLSVLLGLYVILLDAEAPKGFVVLLNRHIKCFLTLHNISCLKTVIHKDGVRKKCFRYAQTMSKKRLFQKITGFF